MATEEGILCQGANLSPGVLLSAYEQGLFPWYNPGEPILWWTPDPRFVMLPEKLHISRSMKRLFQKQAFEVTFDRDFQSVLYGCRDVPRPGQDGTWVSEEIEEGYTALHKLGLVHSVEVWQEGELAGGLYGVSLGHIFFGESMFARRPNASKYGFLTLASSLFALGFPLIDCQYHSAHLESLGATHIPRTEFLQTLRETVRRPHYQGDWEILIPKVTPGI